MEHIRIATVVLEVADLEVSARFYRDALGLDLHVGADNEGDDDDRWISGDHRSASWREGGYFHLSLYQSKGSVTRGAQIGFLVTDLAAAHARATEAGVNVLHPPRPEPWGETARYEDPDGNFVSLTQQRG
jgi:catechol 2,3-dioxygenase-like lactoylglutathione lyase family enzyme